MAAELTTWTPQGTSRHAAKRTDPSVTEVVARALCARTCQHIGGPDAHTLVPGKPNWIFHIPDAVVAIEAMKAYSCKAGPT